MSASRERKKRMAQVEAPVVETKKAKKKLSEGSIFAISVILVIALVFGGIFGYRAWERNQTVLTVGEHEVSVKEFNYFYNATATNFFNYASYLGFDTTTPLDQQEITDSNYSMLGLIMDTTSLKDVTPVDGKYGVTVADILADNAKKMAVEAYAIYDAAVAAGFTMDADCTAEVETEIENLRIYADQQGYKSVNDLLANVYGKGCNEDSYREYMEVVHIAQHYPNEVQYSEAEITARYEESPETFDVASLYVYSIAASDLVEAAEDGTKPEPTEVEKDQAKIAAEAMAADFNLEPEKGAVNLYTDYTRASVQNLCGEEAANWLFDEAAVDGTAVKLFTHNDTYYVLKLLTKGDYDTMNVLQIFVADDAEDAELAEGEKTAEEKVTAVTDALTADASRENFLALATEYAGDDAEIEVVGLTASSMSGVSEDAFLWAFAEGTAVGQWKSFEVSGGTIILMIDGTANTYVSDKVNDTLITEWITEISDAAEAACGYDAKAAMDANVGLVYNGSAA